MGLEVESNFKPDRLTTPSPEKKTHRFCVNPRNILWQKWGGHVAPSPPRGHAPADSGLCLLRDKSANYSSRRFFPADQPILTEGIGCSWSSVSSGLCRAIVVDSLILCIARAAPTTV